MSNRPPDWVKVKLPPGTFAISIPLTMRKLRWTPKTGQVVKRESPLGTAGRPEVRRVQYSEEARR
jgi:hypothetical protein